MEHENARRPVTPPGGLAIGGYDVYRNQLKADRVREYRESLLKVKKAMPLFSVKYWTFQVNVFELCFNLY